MFKPIVFVVLALCTVALATPVDIIETDSKIQKISKEEAEKVFNEIFERLKNGDKTLLNQLKDFAINMGSYYIEKVLSEGEKVNQNVISKSQYDF